MGLTFAKATSLSSVQTLVTLPSSTALPETVIRWVIMDDRGQPVAAEPGVVYSTSPRLAGGADGHEYFIKGPEMEIVVAEALGYELGRRVGLSVPEWALSHLGDDEEVFFASRAKRVRSGVDQIMSGPLVV